MPRPVETCPDREVLAALALGKLAAADIEAIGAHVEQCATCQAVLEALDGVDDSLVKDIRRYPTPDQIGVTPELEAQLQAAEAISSVAWGEPAGAADAPFPLPHQLGQYELLEQIGHGGMGVVYKARHTKLRRLVAVKLIAGNRLADANAVKRFHAEMEAVARLDHPNIVRAYDAGEADDRHFFVMEFLDGQDLRQLVRQSGPLPVAQACDYVRQAAIGLQHAHEHGLVHSDTKPSNLMVTTGGLVKVLDLGLARLHDETQGDATGNGQVVGTAGFMAPEANGGAADHRADIYSLGCTLFFLLTGKPPFVGSRDEQLAAHRDTTPPPLAELRPDVPPALAQIVAGMLAKDPPQRPQSAAEVATALAPFAAGGTVRRGWLWRWIGVGVAVLIVAATIIVYGSPGQRNDPVATGPASSNMPVASTTPTPATVPQSGAGQDRGRGTDSASVTKIAADLPAADGERVFAGHQAAVVGVGIAHDGRRAFSVDRGGAVRSWDLLGDQHAAVLAVPAEPTFAAAFAETPGGHLALLGGADATCRLVELGTGKVRHRLAEGGASRPGGRERRAVTALAMSPDGRRAVSESDQGGLALWDLGNGKEIRRVGNDAGHAVAVACLADNKAAYAVRDGTLRVCDLDTGGEVGRLKIEGGYAVALAASVDGGQLVGGLVNGEIVQWDVAERREVRRLRGHGFPPVALAFAVDGKRLLTASGGDHVVRLWDVASGKQLGRWQSSHGPVACVAVSPDGTQALAGGGDGSLRVWRLPP